jgi:hypothetical protein
MSRGRNHGSRMNWRRVYFHDRMWRQGSEGIKGGGYPPSTVMRRRPAPIKAELLREAAKAFMAWRAKRGQS